MKIQTWLEDSSKKLVAAGVESARLDAAILLEHCLKKRREWVLANNQTEISVKVLKDLNNKLAQRITRTPLAYIIGSKEFYGRNFFVNEDVLIPRPESEAIIELLNEVVSSEEINTIIDLGTGSGCLAVTAKLLHPDIHVTAVDISLKALKVARKNANHHKTQIKFKQLDITRGLLRMPKTRPYVLLANLPYVPKNMITSKEISNEPALALFSGNNGLDHYRKFWDQVQMLKNKPRYIITEALKNQHRSLTDLSDKAAYKLRDTRTLAQLFENSNPESVNSHPFRNT